MWDLTFVLSHRGSWVNLVACFYYFIALFSLSLSKNQTGYRQQNIFVHLISGMGLVRLYIWNYSIVFNLLLFGTLWMISELFFIVEDVNGHKTLWVYLNSLWAGILWIVDGNSFPFVHIQFRVWFTIYFEYTCALIFLGGCERCFIGK